MQIEEINAEKPPKNPNLVRKCLCCGTTVETEDDWNAKYQPLSKNSVPIRGKIPSNEFSWSEIQCFLCLNCLLRKSEYINVITEPRTVIVKRGDISMLVDAPNYAPLKTDDDKMPEV